MGGFSVVDLSSPAGRDLLATLRTEGFVALIGSAVSMWKPCDLPPGMEVTESVATLLSASAVTPAEIGAFIKATAFEHVMEACPQKDPLGDNLLALYRSGTPNDLHVALATLLGEGVIEHIVTTNYDPCLEIAYGSVTPARRGATQCVVTAADATRVDPVCPVLFKIHGCAVRDATRRAGERRSMVFTLGGEGQLLPWKQRLLYRLLAGRNLLVCGYSGLDFEICPELPGLRAKIVWNCRGTASDPDLKDNARRVLKAAGGTALVGDMKELLGSLSGRGPIIADRAPMVGGLDRKLADGLTPWDIDVWRVTLFAGIGCATEAIRLGEDMVVRAGTDSQRRSDALYGLGRGLFHGGRYEQAARRYKEAVAEASRAGNRARALGISLDLSEAERCAGHWLRAWRTISGVERELTTADDWLQAAAALKKVLVLRMWYQVTTKLRPVARKIREACKRRLVRVVEEAAKRGAWLELQQCELWASRLGIPFSEIYSGPLSPLPSREGYRQLGYFIAETMAIRDALQAGRPVPPPAKLEETGACQRF